jgi:hypothetical protein
VHLQKNESVRVRRPADYHTSSCELHEPLIAGNHQLALECAITAKPRPFLFGRVAERTVRGHRRAAVSPHAQSINGWEAMLAFSVDQELLSASLW